MRECRKYWLIAVSSFRRTLLRCWRTFGSPFICHLSDNTSPPRGSEDRFLAQHTTNMDAALAALRLASELPIDMSDRSSSIGTRFTHGTIGEAVAEADIHGRSHPYRV